MIKMWLKSVRVIPRVTPEEWNDLDIISRWLIASRAAVFVMTATAGIIGGLLAFRTGIFSWPVFLLAVAGIVMAHATNNLLNDLVDFNKGIDHNNYYRSQYGPHPLEHKLLSKPVFMRYILISGFIALAIGAVITLKVGPATLWFVGFGLFFLLFYTWPLKYLGLGEISVVLVWGPLMIGGTYFVVTGGHWSNWVAAVSLIYALGPTTVLLGKHTDKLLADKEKGVKTLPVIAGETIARYLTIGLWFLQYILVLYLVIMGYMGWPLLIVLFSLPELMKKVKIFLQPRPLTMPEGYDPSAWPLYLVAHAFTFTRKFGFYFLGGLIIDLILYRFFPNLLF